MADGPTQKKFCFGGVYTTRKSSGASAVMVRRACHSGHSITALRSQPPKQLSIAMPSARTPLRRSWLAGGSTGFVGMVSLSSSHILPMPAVMDAFGVRTK
jgi:hypothetical protein